MQIDLMTLNPYLSSPFLFAKNQLEMGLKKTYLMLYPIGFVGIQFQIAQRWNQLIPGYWSQLTPGYHLSPRTEIERMEKMKRMETMKRMEAMNHQRY